jgi:C-terminal processing protease CtpA/Prc
MQGGPAALSRRILPGDVLLDIDGLSVAGMGIGEVQRRLKGRPGSPITMTLARTGSPAGQAQIPALLQV